MAIKIIFDKPIKYNGKKIEANKIIEITEKEKVDMLNHGAFIVEEGLIGINKNGVKVIIECEAASTSDEEDNKQKKVKKENKGKE